MPEVLEVLGKRYPASPTKKGDLPFSTGDTGYFSPKTSKNSGMTPLAWESLDPFQSDEVFTS